MLLLPLRGDSNFMFSLALVKFTSLTCVRLRRNSVTFITLSENPLSYSMLWFVPSDSNGPLPSHPPLELKTSEGNSLSMSNKLLLSIVLRAFFVTEWIMAVGNCFRRKRNFPATNDLLILYFSFLLLFRCCYQWYYFFLVVFVSCYSSGSFFEKRIINLSQLSIIEIIDKFCWWCLELFIKRHFTRKNLLRIKCFCRVWHLLSFEQLLFYTMLCIIFRCTSFNFFYTNNFLTLHQRAILNVFFHFL